MVDKSIKVFISYYFQRALFKVFSKLLNTTQLFELACQHQKIIRTLLLLLLLPIFKLAAKFIINSYSLELNSIESISRQKYGNFFIFTSNPISLLYLKNQTSSSQEVSNFLPTYIKDYQIVTQEKSTSNGNIMQDMILYVRY